MATNRLTTEETVQLRRSSRDLPPTPPESLDGAKYDYPLPAVSVEPTEVLDVDKKTPDGWVRRDPRLLRLTGVHPFNVEAPLTDLYNSGFLTDMSLFYVRNHGAVPQVQEHEIPDWEISIEGMVQFPMKVTLRELIEEYNNVTYPVTLVCAGNRRKEQNVVRKTKGFSWGAAGVSTALFTGVVLGDILKKAKPQRGARYVCMEGADELPNGRYATSVKLNWALDPNRGFLLAHKMNGEPLRPDHGKPIRAVIPGQIGGRSVKWLKRLIITHEPSDSYYHLMDNRVLPTMISPEESAADLTHWKDERTAIHDLSPNSAIAFPAHGEKLSLSNTPPTYTVKGYAYSGGGRRVTRCEISLDKGKTWRLANIEYLEDRYREAGETQLYGGTLDMEWRESCFCWCFWSLDIAVDELANAKDILVRAMDESMVIQPRDMYWSVLGMMNNPWFRITITKENDKLLFKHPTVPILTVKGWMEEVKAAGGDLTNGRWGERAEGEEAAPLVPEETKEVKMTREGIVKTITIDDLRKHDHEKEPWFVVNGEVYDGTPFLQGHPGGAQSIISSAGLDASDEFMAIHSENAKGMMVDYHIGSLDEEGKAALAGGDEEEVSDEKSPIFLNPRSWKKAELIEKSIVSWDTKIFRFKLDYPEQKLGLPTGQHLMMKIQDATSNEAVIRSYTPTSETTTVGFLDVLVKIYYDTKEKKGGKMSQGLDKLPIGSSISFKGPIGKFEYLGDGRCAVNGAERHITTFINICGGSGITPIFQVVRAVVREKGSTKCIVLDGNRLLEDILCKTELDEFAKGNEEKFKLLYTLTQAPADWAGLKGRIAAPLLKEHADPAKFDREKTMILLCGPEALEKSAHKALLELGWEDKDMLFF